MIEGEKGALTFEKRKRGGGEVERGRFEVRGFQCHPPRKKYKRAPKEKRS